MNFENKVWVVTGGGSGIGRELCIQLITEGAEVAAVDIDRENLRETAAQAKADKGKFSTHILDISDRDKVLEFPQMVINTHGQIDGLINNAGIIQPFVKVQDLEFDAIERVMNVNFYGTINMVKAFLPHLLKRSEAQLVNVSSMGGFLPVPGQSIYGASKAAVKLLTEGLSSELKSTNVHVTAIFPGAVKTNITDNSGVSSPVQDDSEENSYDALPAPKAAETMLKGIKKNKARMMVGNDARMMNYFYRFSPGWATSVITNRMKDLLNDDEEK